MTFVEKFNNPPKEKINILIAPLDWGLGHATRCIPIIRYLNSIDCNVIVASDGIQKHLLKSEFPELCFVNLPGYGIVFSENRGKTLIKIFQQIPKILIAIKAEHRWLSEFLRQHKVDVIISDNRFGLFNRGIRSVFITHQLTIKTPFGSFLEKILRKLNYSFLNKFNECWVPDFEGNTNFGGELSHPKKKPQIPIKFLGRLSRMVDHVSPVNNIYLLIILSGPEPQRTIFENIILEQLQLFDKPVLLVRGIPGSDQIIATGNKHLVIRNHLPATDLNNRINEASYVISRPGYSSIMDLLGLHKKCIFIATPGQSEQEYLATYLSSKNYCLAFVQHKFTLTEAVAKANSFYFHPFDHQEDSRYKEVINEFLENCLH